MTDEPKLFQANKRLWAVFISGLLLGSFATWGIQWIAQDEARKNTNPWKFTMPLRPGETVNFQTGLDEGYLLMWNGDDCVLISSYKGFWNDHFQNVESLPGLPATCEVK